MLAIAQHNIAKRQIANFLIVVVLVIAVKLNKYVELRLPKAQKWPVFVLRHSNVDNTGIALTPPCPGIAATPLPGNP
jgi:hypothetical protein